MEVYTAAPAAMLLGTPNQLEDVPWHLHAL